MPGTNWRTAEGMVQNPGQFISGAGVAAADMEESGWRTRLLPGSRHKAVYKIMDTLRCHNPFSGQEDMRDLRKAAVVFEENIFNVATSQLDYISRISLRRLAWETKLWNFMASSVRSDAATDIRNNYYRLQMMAAGVESSNWRIQLRLDSRERIVNKMLVILKKHLPRAGEEAVRELKNVAVRFEGSVYTSSTSQFEYLRRISLKMVRMELEAQVKIASSLQSNAASNSRNLQPPDDASSTESTHT